MLEMPLLDCVYRTQGGDSALVDAGLEIWGPR